MRPIDVLETFADSSELQRATGFEPRTPIEDGLRSFVAWYRDYHGQK
jgi:UDP-glucuronate 4-epimerase